MLYNIPITNCDIVCSTIFARSVRGKTPTKTQTANVIPIIHANPICHIGRLWCGGALCEACSHKINPFQSPQPVRTFTRKNQQNLILCCVDCSLYKPNTVTLDLGNIFVTFLFVCVAYLSAHRQFILCVTELLWVWLWVCAKYVFRRALYVCLLNIAGGRRAPSN